MMADHIPPHAMSKTHTQLATEAIGFPPSAKPLPKKAKAKAAEAIPEAAPDNVDLTAHVGRFKTFHGIVCRSALEMKLAKYFAGLEVNALCDLYDEKVGICPGKRTDLEPSDSLSAGSLETFLEEHLGVSARTARRYRGFFQSIGSEAPEIADKLNDFWQKMTLPAKASEASTETQLAVSGVMSKLPAETLHAICTHADEWGLHEIFKTPERDVTPEPDPDESNDSQRKKAEREALLKFWTESLVRRLDNEELHRLPAPSLEAVITKMESAMKKAREALAAKAAKKKGGRK